MRLASALLSFLFFAVRATAAPEPFNYQAFEKIIRDNQVRTIEALLPLLPEEYRKAYLFIYESKSLQLQNTFPQAPRVILYGKDSTFVMTFTKNPATPPVSQIADAVETIQWNSATKAFEFREVVFGTGHDPLETAPEINPTKCKTCHGNDPRPNWDPYNLWAGSYGSISRLGCDTMQGGSNEAKNYRKFLSVNRNSGRYAFLPAAKAPGNCPVDPKTEITFINGIHTDANAMLTQQLNSLNYQRINRLVRKSRLYSKFRPFLAAVSERTCSVYNKDLEKFFPDDFAKTKNYRSVEEMLTLTITQSRLDFGQRLQRFLMNNSGSVTEKQRQPINFLDDKDPLGGGFYHRHTVALIRVMAERMKLNLNRWGLANSDGELDFATPLGAPSDLFSAMAEDLKEFVGLSCEKLQELSREALKE